MYLKVAYYFFVFFLVFNAMNYVQDDKTTLDYDSFIEQRGSAFDNTKICNLTYNYVHDKLMNRTDGRTYNLDQFDQDTVRVAKMCFVAENVFNVYRYGNHVATHNIVGAFITSALYALLWPFTLLTVVIYILFLSIFVLSFIGLIILLIFSKLVSIIAL